MKIDISGADNTPYSEFRLKIDGNEYTGEDKGDIVKRHLTYAVDDSGILTKTGDGFIFPEIITSLAKVHQRSDILQENSVGNIVGCFSWREDKDDVTARIRSRFDDEDKPYFLLHMLESCGADLHFDTRVSEVDATLDELWVILLIQLFRNKLIELSRLGFYRKYVVLYENDSRLRGTIDIARQIKLNSGKKNGCIAYHHREMTYDNELNHLIMRASELLVRIGRDHVNSLLDKYPDYRRLISELGALTPSRIGVSDKKLLTDNMKPISSPYYHPYEDMRKICIRIFNKAGISLMERDDVTSVDGFVIYVPDLFEVYARRMYLDRIFREGTLKDQFVIDKPLKKGTGSKDSVRPDHVLFGRDRRVAIVMDSKFKFEPDKDDKVKLIRDVCFAGATELESFIEYRDPSSLGCFVYPSRDGSDSIEWDDICEKDIYYKDEWLSSDEDDPLARSAYLSAFKGERLKKLNMILNARGKRIGYIRIPVAAIGEGSCYSDWKAAQEEVLRTGIEQVREDSTVKGIVSK
ncbi:McrBC 5-methylcytosine restriction system component [Ruminococcaceae bacterium YRB3002]|nr:McrBC 5-methylcytosine restriction system component [Ruminococcaceae bacterium YRB3002]